MTANDIKWLQMTSLNLLGIQTLIWSPFRSFRVISFKRWQNYLYYKHATLLKFALSFFGTQSETVVVSCPTCTKNLEWYLLYHQSINRTNQMKRKTRICFQICLFHALHVTSRLLSYLMTYCLIFIRKVTFQ
jgi:hypothetical protein